MGDIVLLNDMKFDKVKNLPIFKIEYIESDVDLSLYDALIFTSKNAIYAIDSFNKQWQNVPAYCIAPKTAEVVNRSQGNTVFIGKRSHGDEFAQELIPHLKNKKSLYIKACKTVSNLTSILKENSIDTDELIAYKTVCNENKSWSLKKNSVIIFTSPSSVECFFKEYDWHESFKAVVIGKTTAKYMPSKIKYFISEIQSVDSCVKLARTLI